MSFKTLEKNKRLADPCLSRENEEKIKERVKNSMLSCSDGFILSKELGIPKEKIGMFADNQKIRLINCQLGLFGKGPGKKKHVKKLDTIDAELEIKINEALVNGKLSCQSIWEIATLLKISTSEVSNTCESMKIKINKCQFGAF